MTFSLTGFFFLFCFCFLFCSVLFFVAVFFVCLLFMSLVDSMRTAIILICGTPQKCDILSFKIRSIFDE